MIVSDKILHIITDLDIGGAEIMLKRLCSHPDMKGCVVLSIKPIGKVGFLMVDQGVRVLSLNVKRPIMFPFALLNFFRLLKKEDPAVIIAWMYHAALLGLLAKCTSRALLIWNIRQTLYSVKKEKYFTQIVIYTLRIFSAVPDKIIYNSALSSKQHAAFGFKENGLVLANGINDDLKVPLVEDKKALRKELGIPEEALVVGHAARLHPMKGHEVFFRAAEKLLGKHKDLYFVCCGAGVERQSFEKISDNKRVKLLGAVEDMSNFYAAVDLFCSSSLWGEGFSNVLAEAGYYDLRSVATDVGDAGLIVGDDGTLVQPGDESALEIAIDEELSKLRTLKADAGVVHEKIKKNFGIDQAVKRYRELVDQLLAERQ